MKRLLPTGVLYRFNRNHRWEKVGKVTEGKFERTTRLKNGETYKLKYWVSL